MKNLRCYYSADIEKFLQTSNNEILGTIISNDSFSEIKLTQNSTWQYEIEILKEQLSALNNARIIFEYTIPRMGKRVDVVILYQNIVFLLEFKCGDNAYKQSYIDQVLDYALDLQNFQKHSHDKLIVPIVVVTEASKKSFCANIKDNIADPLLCNKNNIIEAIKHVCSSYTPDPFDYQEWENSEYLPTPTIIEAAQALYRGHNVHEITRSDAGAKNLSKTTAAINKIIEQSKLQRKKSICFITGVPGAGKTLVGLNLAIEHANAKDGEHAAFLSGNQPLVNVLQEALARDKVKNLQLNGIRISKANALRETSSFIQIIHKYRDSFVNNENIPPEKVVIFDEAQRAWTKDYIQKFMQKKKGVNNFDFSEPEFLISTMDRQKDWAVIVCLIGGGQEINSGEAGLPEWFDSLRRSFKDWHVFVTPQLNDEEYKRNKDWNSLLEGLQVTENPDLHLATSVRSFRTPDLAEFVKALLDNEFDLAKKLYQKIKDKYPIFLTRDLKKAKEWVKSKSRGTARYGLLASSGALRLKPDGIFVKNDISVANWFLNDKTDVRSSYYLEDVVSEFDVQGLELDFTVVAWDADFRMQNGSWTYNEFRGNKWCKIASDENKMYLKNAYRVLLTRARQGMAIFIPKGDESDNTRLQPFYDSTYNFLNAILENN